MDTFRLKNFCEIFSGFAFSTDDMVDCGTPIIKIGNINGDKTINLNCDCFYNKPITEKLERFLLRKSDYLVCMTGATIGKIGRCAFDLKEKYLINQRVGIMRSKKGIDNDFLYYVLSSKEFRKYIEIVGYGAAQPNISPNDIGKFCISISTNEVYQKKIGKVLSNYDQLIENNNKRIKLLEETAQELYKEWFVRFRFPGYEKEEFEEGKPCGWIYGEKIPKKPKSFEYAPLNQIAEFIRGKNITSNEMIEGEIPVISAGLEPSGYHNDSNVKGFSLTVSASGANAGFLSYHLSDIWAADCSYCQSEYIWFVYNALKFLQPIISNLQCGSAQPHVYAKHLNKLVLSIPKDIGLVKKYNDITKSFYEEIRILNKQNENLTKQRDSLLPRLMSGKISLEGKEII